MGDFFANKHLVAIAIVSFVICVLIQIIQKFMARKKKDETEIDNESRTEAPAVEEALSETNTENRPSTKSKKRTHWKGKTEFNHPWLYKNLKGHPGTVLLVDFSANGKFLAATCDEPDNVTTVESTQPARRRKPRDRRRPLATPSPPPPPPQRISTEELAEALRPHILSTYRRWTMGYPVEIDPNSNKALVYLHPQTRLKPRHLTTWDVNAPEFVPGGSPGDSGRGSWGSTPRSDSDEEVDAVEHMCARCENVFRITREGEYLPQSPCVYHWGRANGSVHPCCNGVVGCKGCTTARYHVWSGVRPGMNGPLDGYVRARSPRGGVYALDAEMCYTTAGLELASIAVVAADGRLVYKTVVKPSSTILDLNTRFSGIKSRDMERATKTLRDVQNDILGFVGTDTILIGHALNNDLRVLKLLHSAVVDTSDLYPHARGFPMRRPLRALTEELLGRTIQSCGSGHSPCEDARAALDLVLLKVHEERAQRARISNRLPVLQPYDPLIRAA